MRQPFLFPFFPHIYFVKTLICRKLSLPNFDSEINSMKADNTILSYNNGSVPPQYAYRYQITFSVKEGNAGLQVFTGYGAEEKMVLSEHKKFSTEILSQLLSILIKKEHSVKNPTLVGGSLRIIEADTVKIIIRPDDEDGISLFNRFLYLYDKDFPDKINKYLNF